VTTDPRLSRLGRWLLRVTPLGGRRAEVEADLLELFRARETERGARYASRRYLRDVLSLRRRQALGAPATVRHHDQPFWQSIAADLKYAVRLFARRPATFALTTVGLALGLGVATATFSMMNAAFLRGDGIEDPDRAPGILRTTEGGVSTAWSYDQFLGLREGSSLLRVEAAVADRASFRHAPAFDDAPGSTVSFVSGGFFQALGGRAALGRPLEPGDEGFDGPVPIVVSHRFWLDRLNADPAVVGRAFWLGRAEARVVGVIARGFTASQSRETAFWAPITGYGPVYGALPTDRGPRMVEVFGRLPEGVELAEAEAQLSGVAAALPPERPTSDERYGARLDPRFGLGRVSSSATLTIAGFVSVLIGLVLLLATANVATVLIALAMTRDREMGVRLAMGAGRGRILRQLVTEGLALGAVGAALGLAFTFWAVPAIARMVGAPAGIDFTPDLNVYLFLVLSTTLVGVAAGLAPAWHGRGADLLTPLKGEGARADRPARKRFRSALVLTQAAASVVLIVLAALLVRATWRASHINVGFEASGLYAVSVSVGYADRSGDRIRAYFARALSDLQSIPGIRSASLVEFPPYGDGFNTSSRMVGGTRVLTYFNRSHGNYFETVGLPILVGRTYTPAEVSSKAPVAVVSHAVARAYWGEASPVGDTLQRVNGSNGTTIIGVVADAITAKLHEASGMAVYQPLDPTSEISGKLVVRTRDGGAAIQQVREALQLIDPLADVRIASIGENLQVEMERPRTLATLAGFVGGVAIVLCVIGIYGLTSSIVGQRTREIGVRVALGAGRGAVLRLLLWDSLRPVLAGLALGTVAALLVGRVIAGTLYGVSPGDPLALGAAAVLLLGSAGLAALIPTRRAAAVDPAFVLRQS
jgi:predicted permease